ncbi:hypothetical protein [Micromonospora matsumotoense]|uniref:Uncharacterized protein n=1 Tax=Micromonospora matsumotoense TaxID=121616 RepID=A0A1C4V590_9ACTN|nr:hypothetical protein [Micromonospora matsumotoense]SCE79208.1 hypothetical protein GA0070216_102139 [Micromonospora matsumotoense]
MAVRVVVDPRRGAVLHVVGSGGDTRRPERVGRSGSPARQGRGPSGPPRRADDRRWDGEPKAGG